MEAQYPPLKYINVVSHEKRIGHKENCEEIN